jgi:hypothetical protein
MPLQQLTTSEQLCDIPMTSPYSPHFPNTCTHSSGMQLDFVTQSSCSDEFRQIAFKSFSEPASASSSVASSPRRHTICSSPNEKEDFFLASEQGINHCVLTNQSLLFAKLEHIRKVLLQDSGMHVNHEYLHGGSAEAVRDAIVQRQQQHNYYHDNKQQQQSDAAAGLGEDIFEGTEPWPFLPHGHYPASRYFEDDAAVLSGGSTPTPQLHDAPTLPEPLLRRRSNDPTFWRNINIDTGSHGESNGPSPRSHSTPTSPSSSHYSTSSSHDEHAKYVLPPILELRERRRRKASRHTRRGHSWLSTAGIFIMAVVTVLTVQCILFPEHMGLTSRPWLAPIAQTAFFLHDVFFEDLTTSLATTTTKTLDRVFGSASDKSNSDRYRKQHMKQHMRAAVGESGQNVALVREWAKECSLLAEVVDMSPLGALGDFVRRLRGQTRTGEAKTTCSQQDAKDAIYRRRHLRSIEKLGA